MINNDLRGMKSSVFPLIFVRVVAATVSCPSVDTWSRQRAELTRLLASHLWDGNIHHADLVVFSVPTLTAFPPQQSCVLFWWAVSFVLFCFFFLSLTAVKLPARIIDIKVTHLSNHTLQDQSLPSCLFVLLLATPPQIHFCLSVTRAEIFSYCFFCCFSCVGAGGVLKGNVL